MDDKSASIEIINKLAEKLGVATDYLIPIFARQQIAVATVELVGVSILGFLIYKVSKWDSYQMEESAGKYVSLGLMLVASFALLADAISTLVAPEAAAISAILRSVS